MPPGLAARRAAEAAAVPSDDAIAPREITHLRLPRAIVAAELVARDEREAAAGLFMLERDAVDACGGHAVVSPR